MEPLTFWDYVKEAFHRRTELPLLGRMPVNKMALGAFAVLGMANPGFWFLGVALEVAYLSWLAGNDRFQKLINAERLLEVQESWKEKVQQSVARLSEEGRSRYRRLLGQCRRILGISETYDGDSLGNFRDLRARSLNQLLGIYLRLLTSKEVILANVVGLDRSQLEAESEKLEKRLAEIDEGPLARSLEGTLEIHRRRLQNLERASESLKVIDAELERIEKQVELIREESAVSRKPEFLSTRLDAVTSAMSETTRWMDRHSDFFSSLGGDEQSEALSQLPDVPTEMEKE